MQCHDVDVPVIRYNFVNLSGLPELQKEAICGMLFRRLSNRFAAHLWMAEILVIVKEIGDLAEITTRSNKTVRSFSNNAIDTSLQMTVYRRKSAI
jgi:hypothetical protein